MSIAVQVTIVCLTILLVVPFGLWIGKRQQRRLEQEIREKLNHQFYRR